MSSSPTMDNTIIKPIQLLFPMGGLGTRFADIGITTPKPLIKVDGQAMILKAISSFSRLLQQGVPVVSIFIVRKAHEEQFGLATLLLKEVPSAKIVFLDHDTRGAVETCLVAEPQIDKTAPLVVCDCDLYFRSKAYEETLLRIVSSLSTAASDKNEEENNNNNENLPSGLLVYMNSTDPRYSYAATADDDPDGRRVTRTAEKNPISNKALIGAYGFKTGAVFCRAAHQLMDLPIDPAQGRKEYYVSLVYNFLLADGGVVHAVPRDEYESFGTPEELAAYVDKMKKRKEEEEGEQNA